eukprot:3873900-Prymnesium_polylepis.1
MVSHYFCVSNQTICPRRHAMLGAANRSSTLVQRHGAASSLVLGLDHFLLSELAGDDTSSLNLMLRRTERLAAVLESARLHKFTLPRGAVVPSLGAVAPNFEPSACQRRTTDHSGPRLHVLHSRYEDMVSDFDSWLHDLLAALPTLAVSKKLLHQGLLARFGDDFVPDGKHKHSLRAGSNLQRLRPETIERLREMPRVAAIVRRLGYEWSW